LARLEAPLHRSLAEECLLFGPHAHVGHVSVQVAPFWLGLVTVNTNCVLVTEVIGTAVPLDTPLMLFVAGPLPPLSRPTMTAGAVPLVSNTNPFGAFKTMVPVPTSPVSNSV